MRKVIISIAITFFFAIPRISAQDAPTTYFPYPEVPAALTTLTERSDYLISHFWDKCNLSNAFSNTAKMQQSFRDFISFMPYASADVVKDAVSRLIKSVKKPADLLQLCETAEDALYGENASFWSDEIYLPFAKAVVNNKKIAKASRERYAAQIKCIEGSSVGMPCPNIELILADGAKASLTNLLSSDTPTILFFNSPWCDDCSIVRLALETDMSVGQLLRNKAIKLISISPEDADDSWKSGVRGYSSDWTAGASLEANDVFDLRSTPCFYIVDAEGKIAAKNLNLPQVVAFTKKLAEKR